MAGADVEINEEPPALLGRRYVAWAAVLGLSSYCIALIATLPARLVVDAENLPPAVTGLSGTVWNAGVVIAGNHQLSLSLDPLSSILNGGLAANWSVTGDGTAVSGSVVAWRRSVTLSDVEGVVGWPLVRALAPGVDADCDLAARLEIASLNLGEGAQTVSGSATMGQGSCRFGGQGVTRTVAVPGLEARVENDTIVRLFERAAPANNWADIVLLPGRRIEVTAQVRAQALISGRAASGPVILEFGF